MSEPYTPDDVAHVERIKYGMDKYTAGWQDRYLKDLGIVMGELHLASPELEQVLTRIIMRMKAN